MNTLNSTTYKLKCLKSVINKCNTSKFFSFVENPFNFIEFKELKKPYDVLTLEELQKIMTTELVEVYRRKVPTKDGVDLWGKEIKGGVDLRNEKNKRYKSKHSLDDIRNYFLFQVFSQGIRVSDLITLRWEHFKEIENDDLRIIKVMVKTREIIRIIVNYNMTSIIGKYLERYSFYFTDELEKLDRENRNIERQQKHILDDINHFVPKDRLWWDYIPTEFKEILQSNQGETKVSNTLRKGFYINKSILNIVSEKLGNIDEYDFQNQGNLNKIHDRILKYRQHKEETNNQDIKDDCDIELRRIELFIKKFFLKLLVDDYNYFSDSILKTREKRLNEFSENKHKIICNMIKIVSNNKETKKEFVFPLLQNKDFTNVFSDDFSRINEDQYRKFQSVRTYYNGLLKIVGSQCNITKRLSSHTSRHTFTSLMIHLIENVSPYDLMNSLGHKNLSTTQLYMRRFNDKNVDRLNQLFPKSVGYIR
jgi:integrase